MPITTGEIDVDSAVFYRRVLTTLQQAGVPALVGGAYAYTVHTGIERPTKDLDLFVRREDFERIAEVLSAEGYTTELTYPHWLGKAHLGTEFVDLIFNSGNGLARVDERWFERAIDAQVLGVDAKIVPVEESLWSKIFIMERERYDGADVAHTLYACARTMDWARVLEIVGPHWRVLLSHLVLFGFIYPAERDRIPARVMTLLVERLAEETRTPPSRDAVCQGTLLSREQFLYDTREVGLVDVREATMSPDEIAIWTQAIPDRSGEPPPVP